MPELRLEEVRKSRPGRDGLPVQILRGISLTAAAGQLTAIIGPSGGGKSTLVRLLNRLEDPDAGRILLDGQDLRLIDPLRLRQRVALTPQKPYMFEATVLENLQRVALYQGSAVPDPAAAGFREILSLCRLEAELLPRAARSLSLGQQQRVSLARALLTGPEALVLDEPTSALDRPTGDRLADTLREVCRRRRLTVLMVTHDLRLAERIADRLAFLADGQILEEGLTADLLARPQSEGLRRFLDTSSVPEIAEAQGDFDER
ncbi:MAG: ATP-binding cassette domain-containing protein [Desulfuromonadales bacterium]